MEDDDARAEKRKSAYSSRLSRARAHNSQRMSLTKAGGTDSDSSMANMAFAIPVQAEVDAIAQATQAVQNLAVSTPSNRPAPKPVKQVDSKVTIFCKPEDENSVAAHWEWNDSQKLLAVTEHTQLLKVIDKDGKTIYRVQLPKEGRTIFLGWEPSGAALAAVQDHGGAFLWFPSKPDSVQQWEGMQFSSQMLRSSALKRNSHFDTCFASWSETRKLVLGLAVRATACSRTPETSRVAAAAATPRLDARGLRWWRAVACEFTCHLQPLFPQSPMPLPRSPAPSCLRVACVQDGNFACWDLQSNETFISRKHFAGKHKYAVTCGAWGMQGQILALGSKNQLKSALRAPLRTRPPSASRARLSAPLLSPWDFAVSPCSLRAAAECLVGLDCGQACSRRQRALLS